MYKKERGDIMLMNTIYNRILNKTRLTTLKIFGYKPEVFWNIWGLNYQMSSQQSNIHNYDMAVYDLIEKIKPSMVLEIGCGFGKNLKELLNRGYSGDKLTGVDISFTMLRQARKNISNPQITFKKADLKKRLPFADGNFDLVYVSKILMHIPGNYLKRAVLEAIRVSRKHVVFCEQYEELSAGVKTINTQSIPYSEFTFLHNYKEYLIELGFAIKDFTVFNNNVCLFRIEKNSQK